MAAAALTHVPGTLPVSRYVLAVRESDLRYLCHRATPSRRRKISLAAPYFRSSIIVKPAGVENASRAASSITASAAGANQPISVNATSAGSASALRYGGSRNASAQG